MSTDALYQEVAEIVRCVLAKEKSIRNAVYGSYYKKDVVSILEVGCGVGNTTFPLMEMNKNTRIFLHSCDYSQNAIRVLKSEPKYDEKIMNAFVWDITKPSPSEAPKPESLDYIVCIYVLSAIHPDNIEGAIKNLVSLLKPGGMLLLKDYGRYDLTQLRFKKDRLIDGNLYCRGDGTLVYFFEMNELEELMRKAGMEKRVMHVDRRLIVNRLKQVKMYRQWIQGKFERPN